MTPNLVVQGGEALFLVNLVGGMLAAPTVGLFIDDVSPGKTATKASFTTATFTGSAPVVLVFGDPYLNTLGDWEILSQRVQFNWTAGASETIFGFLVQDAGAGTALLFFGRLDAPKEMSTVADALAIVIRFVFPSGGFGASIEVS